MKKLLLIAYFYPPLGGPGVQRPSKLVKHLHKQDVSTDVITVNDIVFHSTDNKLLKEDKAHKIIRTTSLDLMSILKKISKPKTNKAVYFSTPEKYKKIIRNIFPIDDKIGWLPFVINAGKKLIKSNDYDAIMATMGPYTSGVAAYKLAKANKLPLIVDYRDHWTLNPYITFFSKFHKSYAVKWEKRILQYASVITVVSKTMKNDLISEFGEQIENKIEVIYNGWDADDFSNFVIHNNKKITIKYIGNFYGHRSLKYFIDALELLHSQNKLTDDLVIQFTGNYYAETIDHITRSKVSHLIKVNPQIEHKDAIKSLMNCDALLLFIASYKGHGVLTGKLFEYLRSGKEILAMVPPKGEAAEVLKQNDHNLICEMENVESIANNFLKLIKILNNNNTERKINSKFSRENQTNKFLDFVEKRLDNRKKIKIVHIQLLPLLSGVQNVMLKILKSLDRNKYEIYVISKPDGPLVEKVKELGYNFIPIRSFRRSISILDIFAFIKLIRVFKIHKFDIVHTHSSKPGFIGRIAARIARVPKIIHSVHGFPFHYAQPKPIRVFYQVLEKLVSPFCDKMIFVNNYEREFAINSKIVKEDKALTILNGIEFSDGKMIITNKKEDDTFVIGSVLRFEKIKNIINTINVAINVCKNNKRIVFYFIGDGKLFDTCNQMVVDSKLEENIIFPGWQNNIKEWLAKFDAYLLFSIAEGLSISILEAMSMSLPIIASNVKGNNELVSDSNGILIPVNDIDRLSAVLLSLPDKKEKLKEWGENSRKLVEEKFNIKDFVKKYEEVYTKEK
ncbi:MAG: glycosyltransferase [Candidatus Cloacimonetes bacterium]|nr:glycosyltransferase [Candidatus Cloacimonadota bacterium]MBT4575692.1 glycosyltransferase [Candidatus Cloacimonadota bacterium]